MVHCFPMNGRMGYRTGSPWERHDDSGSPSSDTANQERALAKRYGISQKTVAKWSEAGRQSIQ